ncbi:hypothetical protein UFOVP28_33 [uncultured Caudovirales phage]|uniref:Uncharacterized protein n=1 Tax=uncultured Caudovirales phage TaxID=2100421 RepID=A0A6J5KRM0_9CAUD|nr:hypothetical protein UFOVP28_33 [uncultured Caudovirales phage]
MTRAPVHPTRSEEERSQETRAKAWRPADQLPMPEEVAGWKYRWVRISTLGDGDTRNVSSARREGWEFVDATDMPDFAAMCDPSSSGHIEFGGLALAKMPVEMWTSMRDYYQQKSDQQVEGVNNQLFDMEDKRMPIYRDHQTTTNNRLR